MAATAQKNLVAYYRVSTKKQGRSGLGLDAQRAAVAAYAEREGLRVVEEFTEVESGRKASRAELAKALSHCRAARSRLVVAKLDRLARNVSFLSALMESGLEFVCLDNPHATPFTLHILAAVAEQEASATSERTRVALAEARKRGVLLGSARPGHWQGREGKRLAGSRVGVRKASAARTVAARQHNSLAVAEALSLRNAGRSWLQVAEELNARGLVTRRGNHWSKSSVFTAVRAAAGCMAVVEATAGVLTGLSNLAASAMEAALA